MHALKYKIWCGVCVCIRVRVCVYGYMPAPIYCVLCACVFVRAYMGINMHTRSLRGACVCFFVYASICACTVYTRTHASLVAYVCMCAHDLPPPSRAVGVLNCVTLYEIFFFTFQSHLITVECIPLSTRRVVVRKFVNSACRTAAK